MKDEIFLGHVGAAESSMVGRENTKKEGLLRKRPKL